MGELSLVEVQSLKKVEVVGEGLEGLLLFHLLQLKHLGVVEVVLILPEA